MDTIPDPKYVTLDASGNGSVTFRGVRPNMLMQIRKLTVETTATGSGTVAIYYRGQLMTSKAIALLMTAVGLLNLGASEVVEARFTGGSANAQMKVTSHYTESATAGAEQETGLAFTDAVGFTQPVDNPVTLASLPATVLPAGLFNATEILDMRAFNSVLLRLDATNGGGATFLDTDVLRIDIVYYADALGNIVTFRDQYMIYRTDLGGSPGSGQFQFTNIAYGPYMQMFLGEETAGGRTLQVAYDLLGSYRALGAIPRLLSGTESNGLLYRRNAAYAAAPASNVSAALMAYGRAQATLVSGAAGGATMTIAFATLGGPYNEELVAGAANTRVTREFIIPKRQMRVTVTNNAGAQNIQAWISLQQ